ncbi:uncharacterized protein EI90DRAFT_3116345 [Cantharellus anzutake]|uniref:uncharacterized protein n=1 Tax=Cantharellus anzutake TaxID=1750568 RepID=UPI0019060044|nr:uncharacterized protein EI90DRAFT_3116345 [Cantharellus anzutake]KAF8341201.1 hypothetical protein EI90DRAFT_3116345 [Cantharellus anzutake]
MELWTLLAATPGSALLPVVSKPRGPKATSTPDGPGSSTTQQHRPQQDHPPYYTLGGVHHYAAMISRVNPLCQWMRPAPSHVDRPNSRVGHQVPRHPDDSRWTTSGETAAEERGEKLREIGVPNQQLHSVFDYSSRKDRERLQEPMIAQAVL